MVLVISALFFASAYFYATFSARTKDELRFKDATGQAQAALEARIASQISLLRGAAGLMSIAPDTDRVKFRRFAQRLQIQNNKQGVLGVGWAPRLANKAQQEAFVKELRSSTNRPELNLQYDSEPTGTDVYAVKYIEPFGTDAEKTGLGFDMFSEKTRHDAMAKARDTGTPVMSATLKLRQLKPTPSPLGFLIYVPVYDGGTIPETEAERRQKIIGFVYSPYRAADLLNNRFIREYHGVVAKLYDSSGQMLSQSRNYRSDSGPQKAQADFEVAGRTVQMRFVSTPEFDAGSDKTLVSLIPIIGALISFVLFALSSSQSKARSAAESSARNLRRAVEGQTLLIEAGRVLAASLDYRTTLDSVARLAVPKFADWCGVDMLVDGELQRISVAHRNPEKVKWARELQDRFPVDMDSPTGVPNVLRTGKSELYPTLSEEFLMKAAVDDEQREVIRQIGFTSAMVVPLAARGRVLGAITLVVAESGWHYNEDDLKLAEQIAARAAIAVDNALLFQEKEKEIDDRQHAEDQVRQLNEKLEGLVEERTRELQVANLELEAFCYSVSHDLRSPLRSVDGFAQAVLEDYGTLIGTEGSGFLGRIRAAARRMDELITALLALSRVTRSEMHRQPIDISALAQEAAEDLTREMAAEAVEIKVQAGLEANGDPKMLRIVLDNLIGNAIKFSKTKGAAKIEVGATLRDGKETFFVRDEGVGFNPEFSGKLFRPFERLHSPAEFPGSGIGLATVQRIIAKHGGETFAESQEGKGATFFFTLP